MEQAIDNFFNEYKIQQKGLQQCHEFTLDGAIFENNVLKEEDWRVLQKRLPSLQSLTIKNSELEKITLPTPENEEDVLFDIDFLDLSGNQLKDFEFFKTGFLPSIVKFRCQDNGDCVKTKDQFSGLRHLERLQILDLQPFPGITFRKGCFDVLPNLYSLNGCGQAGNSMTKRSTTMTKSPDKKEKDKAGMNAVTLGPNIRVLAPPEEN